MAELNSSPEKKGGKSPRKKFSARVDLTAMVDLAFLLITFFMLTTTLQKARIFQLDMPVGPSGGEAASRTLTVCLGSNHQVVTYLGLPDKPIVGPNLVGFDKDGLRKTIADMKRDVEQKTHKSILVIVKPSDKSLYGDMVGALDELKINSVEQYAVADIMDKDIAYLKDKKVY